MKIFGWEITRQNGVVNINRISTPIKAEPTQGTLPFLSDAPVSVVSVSLPKFSAQAPAVIQSVKSPGLTYSINRSTGRGAFQSSEYNLSLMGRIEDTDGYVRQAFKKKIGLMFKEGWHFVSKNPKHLKYIKIRFQQIAQASGIPTQELLRSIGSAIIKKSNGFLIKVRKTKASGGRVRVTADGKTLKPIAAYFVLPAETLEVDVDEFGRIRQWRQNMPSGRIKKFKPADVVHFYFDRKEGFVFGTPTLIPVIDDIRALRKIEENIELLVYQHLFPLFHYQVGTPEAPAGWTEDGKREVEVVKQEIQFMPTEGGIVTPERHKITAIGAEGRALRAESYLKHFKQRVFSGLGVSAVDMGEGETANRATADNMSRALIDDVKDFQDVIECQINEFIINELLLESTFGDEVLNEENLVGLQFKEIDVDKKIKVEAHAADQFAKSGITWDELRATLGLEAIPVPDVEEPDDSVKFHEWSKTYFKLFQEPLALIQAIDEPFSAASKAAAGNKNTSLSQPDVDEQQEKTIVAKEREAKARKPVPKPSVQRNFVFNDNFLGTMFDELEETLIYELNTELSNLRYLDALIRAQATQMVKRLSSSMFGEFMHSYVSNSTSELPPGQILRVRTDLETRAIRYVGRLSNSLIVSIARQVDTSDGNDRISLVRSIFKSLRFRTSLITDVENRRASNFGFILALKQKGVQNITFKSDDPECEKCSDISGNTMKIELATMEDIPPFHGQCHCRVEAMSEV